MAHVFVVDETTFKYHLEYLFAGTGAKDKESQFLLSSDVRYPSTTERMLTGMIADISRIRIGDKVIFYLQSRNGKSGMFYGVFKVVSKPFFDENDQDNYLVSSMRKGLSFRVLIESDEVFSEGISEHEYLDSLKGKKSPYQLCWSLIYRKLKANRGCTMITDYEYQDLFNKLKLKNKDVVINSKYLTFDENADKIISSSKHNEYLGRKVNINILPRLLHKSANSNAFETHLQAYITQNFDSSPLEDLLLTKNNYNIWIGNEVSCGVGMQRIDVLIKEESDNEVILRLVELKDEAPYENISKVQIPWYLEWLSDYIIPTFHNKAITVIPTIIARGQPSENLTNIYKNFAYSIPGVNVSSLEYIGFNTTTQNISFKRFI